MSPADDVAGLASAYFLNELDEKRSFMAEATQAADQNGSSRS